MKFWQKLFLVTLLLFLLGFTALLIGFLTQSNKLNEQLVMQSAQTEMQTLCSAAEEKLRRVAAQHTRFTTEALRVHLRNFSELYKESSAFFLMDAGGGHTYSSFATGRMDTPSFSGGSAFFALEDRLYYAQRETLSIVNTSIEFTLLKDVSMLTQYRGQLIRYSIAIYAVAALLLAGILLALVLQLTKPLRKLTSTAEDIARGQLDQRVAVRQRDEIGAFAASFNHMADAVQRQMTALEESNAQRQWFIDSLSHELRTPVTAIVGYGELLLYANVQPQEREKALSYIIEQGNRIQGLSEKLLYLARLQHEAIEAEPVDLRDTAMRAMRSLTPLAREKGVRLSSEVMEATVLGDAALLETLALNLLENAVCASGNGQEVWVRTRQQDGHAYLEVRDEGIGIALEEQQRVMEAFYRVDPSRSRKNGGAGLGLTLCKQICLLHQATFSIQSELDKGCTITVEFTSLQ